MILLLKSRNQAAETRTTNYGSKTGLGVVFSLPERSTHDSICWLCYNAEVDLPDEVTHQSARDLHKLLCRVLFRCF